MPFAARRAATPIVKREVTGGKYEPQLIWEDTDILVLCKEAGWVCAVSPALKDNAFLIPPFEDSAEKLVTTPFREHLAHYIMLKWGGQPEYPLSDMHGGYSHLWGIAHRLDVDTSGALLLAKTELGFEHLRRGFRQHDFYKEYMCLVHGFVEKRHGVIEKPIAKKKNDDLAFISKHGAWAKSIYTVMGRYTIEGSSGGIQHYSLCRLVIISGRTHQIRVHMKSIGHPLVNDCKYGQRGCFDGSLCCRIFLHAWCVGFYDIGGKWLDVRVPLTKDLATCIGKLDAIPLDSEKASWRTPRLSSSLLLHNAQQSLDLNAGRSGRQTGHGPHACEVDGGESHRPRSSSSLSACSDRLDIAVSARQEAVHSQTALQDNGDKDLGVLLPSDDEAEDTDTPVAAPAALIHTLPQSSSFGIALTALDAQKGAAQTESLESPSAAIQRVGADALTHDTEWQRSGLCNWEVADAKASIDDWTPVDDGRARATGTSPRGIASEKAVRRPAPKRLWKSSRMCTASQRSTAAGTEVRTPIQLPRQGRRVWKSAVSEAPHAVTRATTDVDQYEFLTGDSLAKATGPVSARGSQMRKRLWLFAGRVNASQPAAVSGLDDIAVKCSQETACRRECQPQSETEAALKALGF